METVEMKIIARMYCDYKDKFGIPRQSGLVKEAVGKILFEPEYRNPDALRGLEGFSHIWLLWHFSKAEREDWSPTVRPPKLGGNRRMGVFATRSPFRPSSIGLSSVKIERIEPYTNDGPVIYVSGADLLDASPILDIKPYIPYADCHRDALSGFTADLYKDRLMVVIPRNLEERIKEAAAVREILALDPRPGYQNEADRIYKLTYGHQDIHFKVEGDTATVTDVTVRRGST